MTRDRIPVPPRRMTAAEDRALHEKGDTLRRAFSDEMLEVLKAWQSGGANSKLRKQRDELIELLS